MNLIRSGFAGGVVPRIVTDVTGGAAGPTDDPEPRPNAFSQPGVDEYCVLQTKPVHGSLRNRWSGSHRAAPIITTARRQWIRAGEYIMVPLTVASIRALVGLAHMGVGKGVVWDGDEKERSRTKRLLNLGMVRACRILIADPKHLVESDKAQ